MAIRLITKVLGKAPRSSGNITDVTFLVSGAAGPQTQQFTITYDNLIAASFSVGQTVNWYKALNSTEITQIEASGATITKGSTKD